MVGETGDAVRIGGEDERMPAEEQPFEAQRAGPLQLLSRLREGEGRSVGWNQVGPFGFQALVDETEHPGEAVIDVGVNLETADRFQG